MSNERSPARPLRWRLEALSAAAAIGALQALPERAALAGGSQLGALAARAWPRYRAVALANLRVAFPEWDARRREAVLSANLRHLGRTLVEWARLPGLPPEALATRVEIEGAPLLAAAFERGRGVLAVTAHYGFWEAVLPALRARAAPRRVTAVGRPQPNPRVQALVEARRRLGDGPPTLPQSALAVRRVLRAGGGVGVLSDHYLSPRRGGRLAPFLGRRVWTHPGPARLAVSSGCALLLVRSRPLGAGRHRITIGPEIAPPRTGDRERDVASVTEALNAAVAGWIRERPELWLWLHERFRASPDVPPGLARDGWRAHRRRPGRHAPGAGDVSLGA